MFKLCISAQFSAKFLCYDIWEFVEDPFQHFQLESEGNWTVTYIQA